MTVLHHCFDCFRRCCNDKSSDYVASDEEHGLPNDKDRTTGRYRQKYQRIINGAHQVGKDKKNTA